MIMPYNKSEGEAASQDFLEEDANVEKKSNTEEI
jgi:hypothetical protein